MTSEYLGYKIPSDKIPSDIQERYELLAYKSLPACALGSLYNFHCSKPERACFVSLTGVGPSVGARLMNAGKTC